MIKRLRRQVFIILFSIFVLLMIVIFTAIYGSTAGALAAESRKILSSLALHESIRPQPSEPADERRLPYFSIKVDDDGNLRSFTGDYYDLSDEAYLEALAKEVTSRGVLSATVDDAHLRYVQVAAPDGTEIHFLDLTNEEQTLRDLRRALYVIGIPGLFLLAFLAAFLSRWIVRPIKQGFAEQKRFVSDASHELKTPLTVILTDADLLQKTIGDNEEQRALVGGISDMATQMRGLVSGLLDLAHTEEGADKRAMEAIDLSALLQQALLVFEPIAFEQGFLLAQDVADQLRVHGVESQLRQVIDVLFDNALKYATPASTISVTLRAQAGKAFFTVDTAGEPLSEQEAKAIFHRFYRADKARDMNASYGLGLSIAERIIKHHRGRIYAEGKAGRNLFTVELPLL